MKRSIIFSLVLVLLISIVVPASLTFAKTKKVTIAETASVADLQAQYAEASSGSDKVRVLVVPGHEPNFGGAEYKGVYEREIVVETADQLAAYLRQNARYDVIVARSNTNWNNDLNDSFEEDWDDIEDFVADRKDAFYDRVEDGDVEERDAEDQVSHAAAPADAALRLYGINRWANENDVDLVVHLHINDAPDHGPNEPGKNSGFAVYVPDSQYGNADTSRTLGASIAARLSAMQATSTLNIENKGVVEDQELIALGAFDTLSVPSALVEYGYITEPRFMYPEVRTTVTKDYAYETYLGIQDFFGDRAAARFPTASLPFTFATSSISTATSSPALYALQAGLHTLGLYPSISTTTASTTASTTMGTRRSLTECPIDGVTNSCVTDAIKEFQASRSLEAIGTLGPRTTSALNQLFGSLPIAVPVVTPMPMTPVASTTASTTVSSITTTAGLCALPESGVTFGDKDTGMGDVSKLQTLLAKDAAIYPSKLITGYFGDSTLAAVQKFQIAQKIVQEGVAGYGLAGPKTITALEAAYCK